MMMVERSIALATAALLGALAAAHLGACARNDERADAGRADAGSGGADGGVVCTSQCDGKQCGDDGCGGLCGRCAADERCGAGFTCEPSAGPDAGAADGGCAVECANKGCGDDDGCGGRCPDGCTAPGDICDATTYTCIPDPCAGKGCGEISGSYVCMGKCPNEDEECKVDPTDPTKARCVTCSPQGAAVGAECAAQADCTCGSDCVKLYQDDAACAADQTKCQPRGQCLEDCFSTGRCADPTQLCACTKGDATNSCIAGDCFSTGTLTGSFAGRLLDNCADQPSQTDIGTGNLTATVPGTSVTADMFLACRYVSSTGDFVIVQGAKACGASACPDIITIGVKTPDCKVGTIPYSSGSVLAEWAQQTHAGKTLTDVWVRALGVDGSLTLTAAGTTGKAPISGSVNVKLVKYDYESCGGTSGVSCE